MPQKLIEIALPLKAINRESAREKSIRHGHPSTLHLWWARRPLATARAVIFASLVDDPSSHPEQFPTEEAVKAERERLFGIIEELVKWENSNNETVLEAARAEIRKSTGGNPPPLLDPFAGGGSIPLEAQRLGLKAYASDLNPVAVMINKAMIEIPPRFAHRPPVNPEARKKLGADRPWRGAQGLAEDVRYYGEWMKQEAFQRIGHLYPKVKLPPEQGGGEATVIAWIWARTVKCPNPVCACEMPLASSFVLSKKKGKEAWIEPLIDNDKIGYVIKTGKGTPPDPPKVARGAKFQCIKCKTPVTPEYIKNEAIHGRMSSQMMAVVAEGTSGRIYLSPNNEQISAALVDKPTDYPDGELPGNTRWFSPPVFGLTHFSDLFTPRQLTALTTFSDLVQEAMRKAEEDALAAGMADDAAPLAEEGRGARAYGQAVGVYLAFVVDKLADWGSSICSWNIARDGLGHTFTRQAIPMVWDFAEANPFSSSSGCFDNMLDWIIKCVQSLPAYSTGNVEQRNAKTALPLQHFAISSDPPYYDNIGYADLSDFFYIWLRKSLKAIYPHIFRTMLVPKTEELVATPYRFDGSIEKAREFFEKGMLQTCQHVYACACDDIPTTFYYAYKQSEEETEIDGTTQTASTGWETMLNAILQAGFTITGTWPVRSERSVRINAIETNALASSIVIVCRKRPPDAPACTRREFINALKRELPQAVEKLLQSNIAPVDLAQSAIGPGMRIFSRYSRVLEADGAAMTVRRALHCINEELDAYVGVDDLDAESRFCLDVYRQYAFNHMKFGDADQLARARNTAVETLKRQGVVYADKGMVHLVERPELPALGQASEKNLWLFTQQLTHAFATGGIEGCAARIAPVFGSGGERAKSLAYRLYTIADQKGWTAEAFAYNALIVAWQDIQDRVAILRNVHAEEISLL